MNRKFFKLIWICWLLLSSSLIAQPKRPGQNLLNDIEIMETVLTKMLNPGHASSFFSEENSRGFYLADYGIIFNVPYSFSDNELVTVNLNQLLRRYQMETVVIGEESETATKINITERLAELKKSITRFMGVYASSIRELSPNEKISVIVDFNGAAQRFIEPETKRAIPRQLICTVRMDDLSNYRQGKISDSVLESKLEFKEENSIAEDISIFGNVIKTSLQQSRELGNFNLFDDVKGFHFQDHGVLFVTVVNWNFAGFQEFYLDGKDNTSIAYSITNRNNQKSREELDNRLKKLERQLIRSISNYGHTLDLKPEDWIEVAVKFNGALQDNDFSKSVIKVQKKIIDDFRREKINFDQFQNMVQVIHY